MLHRLPLPAPPASSRPCCIPFTHTTRPTSSDVPAFLPDIPSLSTLARWNQSRLLSSLRCPGSRAAGEGNTIEELANPHGPWGFPKRYSKQTCQVLSVDR